jgi:hypothetical protein
MRIRGKIQPKAKTWASDFRRGHAGNNMADIHPIKIDEIDRLGVDDRGQLYWDNQPVITKQKVSLDWWVNTAAIIAGVCTFITTVLELTELFKGIA